MEIKNTIVIWHEKHIYKINIIIETLYVKIIYIIIGLRNIKNRLI